MITSKYHIATLVSVFLALGIGLLIGGTMGQNWTVQAEDKVVDLLLNKYREETERNLQLEHRSQALVQMIQWQYPALKGKELLWLGDGKDLADLRHVMEAAGASWSRVPASMPLDSEKICNLEQCPDYLLVSNPNLWEQVTVWAEDWKKEKADMDVICIENIPSFGQPPLMLDFMKFINQLSEEHAHEAIRFYYYSGLE